MKIKIIDADAMGVHRKYSNGDVVEVKYNDFTKWYRGTEEPFVFHVGWEGKYFEVIEEDTSGWSGEGLPPVGTVCEILGTASGSWSEGVIDYIDSEHCIWHWLDGSQETIHNRVCAMQFRPIKSEKDKAVEELMNDLYESIKVNGVDSTWRVHSEYLYSIGYRKTK